jgi:undecaprenyl diphosphate synthase
LAAIDRGVKFVSAYVFSTENWNRTAEEVGYLMDLLVWVATKEVQKYVKEGNRIVFVGSRARLSAKVRKAIDSAEVKTAHNTRGTVALCLNYGGHAELAEGVTRLMRDGVRPEEVTPERLSQYLYRPELPVVDLVIRTSGEQRLSGFMLWRVGYAELYFATRHWPAFTVVDLDLALADFAARKRRYGK